MFFENDQNNVNSSCAEMAELNITNCIEMQILLFRPMFSLEHGELSVVLKHKLLP